jgi:mRNA interferase RelE/StbE
MCRIIVERSAEKDLKKLSAEVRAGVGTAISLRLQTNGPLAAESWFGTGRDWRIHAGDYRFIHEVADEIRIVRINRVRHRRDIYR